MQRLVESGAGDSSVGAVCGKLLSIAPGFEPLPVPRIDSAGMYFTPNMRHFDRGWHEREEHRYDRRGIRVSAPAPRPRSTGAR